MSIILDALKKSERERRDRHLPQWADLPAAAPRGGTPLWMPLAVGVLGTLVVVLGWGWWSTLQSGSGASPPPGMAQESGPGAATLRIEPIPELQPPRIAAASGAAVRPLSAEARTPPESGSAAGSAGRAASSPATGSPAAAPTAAASAHEQLPSFHELRSLGEPALPELHLDLHVYTQAPGQRFVFINNQRLGEGDALPGGPRVVEILPEGVILEQQQQRFILPSD